MIELKNRSREIKTYQYPREVSAGPVRPQAMSVTRTKHNSKTGDREQQQKTVSLGGVLTLLPGATATIPDSLLTHPGVQRDLKARLLIAKALPDATSKASAAPLEHQRSARAGKPSLARKE